MELNYEFWRFWMGVVQLVGTAVLGIYVWWTNREKVNSTRFKSLENEVRDRVTEAALTAIEKDRAERCDRHQARTSSIENELHGIKTELKYHPNQTDIARVHARMDTVSKELDQAVGEFRATRRQLDLVLEALIKE